MIELKQNSTTKAFDFRLEEIEGSIQPEGVYHGVRRLVDRRSGRNLIHPDYSALNLFKLMAVNLCMDSPRNMTRTVQVAGNAVEIRWPATETHRADLVARYEVHEPSTIDLTVTVRTKVEYAGYELFLSNYFDETFRPYLYLKTKDYTKQGETFPDGEPQLVCPTMNEAFRGTLIFFPRDNHGARRCLDGRWDRNERGMPIVQVCPLRHYAHPLAFVTTPDRRLGAVMLTQAEQCYAISTRYYPEKEADRLTHYSAFDFALFGHDAIPASERTVRMRLVVTPLDDAMSQPLALYRDFQKL